MLYQIGVALRFEGWFTASKQGKTGLTVTVDVYNHLGVKVVSDGSATEVGGGFYTYLMAANLNTGGGHYRAAFKTADATVDFQQTPALDVVGEAWVERVDASVNSRLASASYTTPPTVAEIEDGVLDALTADHATAGTIGKAIGDAGSGSVTVDARVAISEAEAALVSSGRLSIRSHFTYNKSLTSTVTDDLSTATQIWLTIKTDANKTDNESVLWLKKTGGLVRLNGSGYGTPAHGTLAVTGASGAWSIDPVISHDATALLGGRAGLVAEVKAKLATGRTIPVWTGPADIIIGITKET